MRKSRLLAVALCAALVGMSLVSPAFGGPSPLAVAKKALRVANGTNKALKRSYNRTHPTELIAVDGGERSAKPLNFAEWDISCPRNGVVAGSAIGYGALDPVADLSYGDGALITLFNPSETQVFRGSVVINCVWGLGNDAVARASAFGSKSEALRAQRRAERARLAINDASSQEGVR